LTIREARLNAGLTQQRMSEVFEIPKRTIENWEAGKRNPPAYVEKLIIRELERIATENNK
jgi:DNA-binding transcriptional regulator YiaG